VERLEYLLKELDAGILKMDFATAEQLELDREHAPWPASQKALDDLWRKRLKAAVLGMKLNGKELEEIEELLTKRYKNRLKNVSQTNSEDAFQLYVNAFAATYDPHTQYFSPRTSENFNINMSLSLEGIGAVLRTEDEYTEVVRVVPAGPADKSGLLKPSDRIIGVGQGEKGKVIDVVGWRLDDVVELIRGPKDSVVQLEIVPASSDSGESKFIKIVRNMVQLEEQSAQKKLITLKHNGVERKIGIIEVPTFYVDFKAIQEGDENYKSTTRDVGALIEELKAENIEGLVIDLRNNGGGSLQEADSLTGLFIKSGPTVQVKTARRRANVYADTDDEVAWDGPLAVMVNRLSASASEIFAGAIQDYERGIIIGSQTFGKGTVQTLIPLNRGQLKITQAKFYRVSGQSTQHQGILPDIEFPELYDTDRIGESSLDDALPWDVIKPAVYPRSNAIAPVLELLKTKHSGRATDDPDFQYYRALALKSRENAEQAYLSLNEAERRRQKEEEDAWRLDLENALRKAKGEPVYASLDELDAELDAEAAAQDDAEDDAEDDADAEESDAFILESAHILLDYIGLTRQVAQVETPLPEGSPTDISATTALDGSGFLE
jgi:carboxyl-terminal processing protease